MRLLEFLNRDAALLRKENAELRARAVTAENRMNIERGWAMRYRNDMVKMQENHRKTVAELSTQYADELQKRLELAARVRKMEYERRAGVVAPYEGKHDCDDCGNSGSEHCKHCVTAETDGKRSEPSHWTPRVWEESKNDI